MFGLFGPAIRSAVPGMGAGAGAIGAGMGSIAPALAAGRPKAPGFIPPAQPAYKPGGIFGVLFGDALRKRRMMSGGDLNSTMPVPYPGLGGNPPAPATIPFSPGAPIADQAQLPALANPGLIKPGMTIQDVLAAMGPMMHLMGGAR